jgi:hypothetical protein
MAQIHWKNPVSANFNTAADWSTGSVPGASDDAILDAKGAAFTVTATTNETVNSIQLSKNATLAIADGLFTATNGTSTGVNAGTIALGDRTGLVLGGTVDNSGSITLTGSRYGDTLQITALGATLSGGGQIALNDFVGNTITGAGATATLTNVDNTISGGGQLGDASMSLVNEKKGVIDASATNTVLNLNTSGGGVTNAGLIEATGAAGLSINSTTIGNAGGIILAGAGSHVNLATADIVGGTLTTTGSGVIQTVDGGSVLDGTKTAVTNAGVLDLLDRTGLTLDGAITNTAAGVIDLIGTRYGDTLTIGAPGATLTGGQVILNDFGGNFIEGTVSGPNGSQTVSKLTNNTTISGAGVIGNGQLSLTNTGVIDATGANALTLDTGGGNAVGSNVVNNTGTIESTNPGGLGAVGGLILSGVTISNKTTGVIEANGAATHVDLRSATISGGTLKTLNGGVIDTVDNASVLDGTKNAVNNTGSLVILDRTGLTLQGTIANTGSISLASSRYGDTLTIGSVGAVLSGAGHIVLDDASNNTITGVGAASTLTNVDNTITGAGQVGAGSLTLINESKGVIDASATNNALVLNTDGEVVANAGLIEATGAGGLNIVSTTIQNSSGGTILATIGSRVVLQSADIIGGILSTSGSGVIQTANSDGGSILDGVTNGGVVDLVDRSGLTLRGTIDNIGSINLESTRYGDTLTISGSGAILNGAGAVVLDDASNNTITGVGAAATLTNVNDTISGAGQLGNGALTLINESKGVIDASASVNALVLNTSGEAVVNDGLIEATGAGGLIISSTTVNNAGGGVILAGAGSHINLATADIVGGVLNSTGAGVFQTVDAGSVLDGTTSVVVDAATIDILDRTGLTLQGTIDNTGSINLESTRYGDTLAIDAFGAVLSGGGQIVLDDAGNNFIDGGAASDTLTNVDNTISGAGQLGYGSLTLINESKGVIDASATNNALVLDTNGEVVTNAGLIEATGAGGLTIKSTSVNGSTGGIILAGAGSHINLATADIVGGTLTSTGSGVFQTVDGGTVLDGSRYVVDTSATIDILDRTGLTLAGTIDNNGTIALDGSRYGATLTLAGGNVVLEGDGAIVLNGFGGNRIVGSGGVTTLTNEGNVIEGYGQFYSNDITFDNVGGSIDANGSTPLVLSPPTHTIINSGTLEGTGSGGLVISGATVIGTGGVIFAGSGSSVTLTNSNVLGGFMSTAASGVITIGDGSSATLDGVRGDAGTILLDSAGSATSLTFDKSTSLSGGGTLTLSANADNVVTGTKATVVLTNVNDTIEGSGALGNKKLALVNESGGVIDANAAVSLSINTGAATITNAGLIEATTKASATIASAVANSGTIEANGGTLTLQAAVSGSGVVAIVSGTLDVANANAAENVAFTGKTGTLVLAHSETFTGQVSGFSLTGKTSLDLRDVGFVGAGEATFSGTANGGVLTVTDGTHTADINLTGDYLNSTFVASSDGHGGVKVVDPTAPQMSTHAMVAAMAGMVTGPAGSGAALPNAEHRPYALTLLKPMN